MRVNSECTARWTRSLQAGAFNYVIYDSVLTLVNDRTQHVNDCVKHIEGVNDRRLQPR